MANSENTAVNELIARVSGGSTSSPSATPPSPSSRQGAATTQQAFPAHTPAAALASVQDPSASLDHAVTLKVGAPMHTAHPMAMPVAAPFETRPGLPISYPVVSRATIEPTDPAIANGPGAAAYGNSGAAYGTPGTAQPWPMPVAGPTGPEPTPLNAPRDRSPDRPQPIERGEGAPRLPGGRKSRRDEHLIGTLRLTRRSDLQIVIGKLVLPMTILLVAGMLIGGYVRLRGEGGLPGGPPASASDHLPAPPSASVPAPPIEPSQPAAAPAVAVEPAVARTELLASPAVAAPAPAAAIEAPAAPAAPAEGGAVPQPGVTTAAAPQVLVDVRIDSTPSGATVMLVDRGKTQYVGNTPVSAAVDPSHEYDLVLTYPGEPTTLVHLDATTTRRVAVTLGARASAAKPADGAPHHLERAAAEPPATRRPTRQLAEPGGEGTLKISSKPPCEIVIDGKPTGLVTPQLAIALPAGNHRVTLVNREKDIKKTVSVQISANTTEKVIEDLMK
jgi:hypothetical protein